MQKVKSDKIYNFILISVVWNKNRVRTSLNMPIEENLWDFKKQRVKSAATNTRKINDKLDDIRLTLNEFYDKKLKEEKDYPNKKEVKQLINSIITGNPIEMVTKSPQLAEQKNFFQHFLDFIEATKNGDRLSDNGKRITPNTLKSYGTTRNHLLAFIKTSKIDWNFDNIDETFFSQFTKYMSKKELSNNSQGRVIKIIKTFMHYSFQHDLHNNRKFIKALKVFNEDSTIVALSKEELERLENLEGLSPNQQNLKTLFLIEIYTGLRYSDLANLKPENINFEDRIITIYTVKTKEPLIIPITTKLKNILQQYPEHLPVFTNQNFNNGLKVICKIAGIDTPIQITKYISNKRIDSIKPKYELVSSHTARRTFITLSLKKGILPEMVMKVSGHKSRKSFQRYVRITQEEAVKVVMDAWEE